MVVNDVDHRHLNIEVPWLEGIIPSAENLARVFFDRVAPALPDGIVLTALTVHETDRNSATFIPILNFEFLILNYRHASP